MNDQDTVGCIASRPGENHRTNVCIAPRPGEYHAAHPGTTDWNNCKCRLSKKYLAVVAIFILAGTVIAYGKYADGFGKWKQGEISVIVPEDYEITVSDYRRLALIPVTIDGGMFGLYLAVAVGALLAAGKTLLKNRIEAFQAIGAKERLQSEP